MAKRIEYVGVDDLKRILTTALAELEKYSNNDVVETVAEKYTIGYALKLPKGFVQLTDIKVVK